MNPVTGPYSRTIEFSQAGWYGNPIFFRRSNTWYRQRKPYDAPLPYSSELYKIDSVIDPGNPRNYSAAPSWDLHKLGEAYNKAYSKFKESVGDEANWAVNLAEYRQSMGMILNRVIQLTRFARAVNRFDFKSASRHLGLDHIPRGVKAKSKALANNWLEYHFGWEPLVKDIGSSVDLLQSPPKRRKIKGSAQVPIKDHSKVYSGDWWHRHDLDGHAGVTIRAEVEISNPNLFLANQMGFTNPLVIAWELVPFSFVVDWFVNVGDVLSSFTDFLGVSFTNLHWSEIQVASVVDEWWRPPFSYTDLDEHGNPVVHHIAGYVYAGYTGHSVLTVRHVGGLPSPTFSVRPFKGVSPVRGATAISLLLQQMR